MGPSKPGIDAWAKMGSPHWSYDALIPYYEKVYSVQPPDASTCNDMAVSLVDDSNLHAGPIEISFPGLVQQHPMAKAWNEVFRKLGYNTTTELFPTPSAGNRCYTAAADAQTGNRMSADSQYGQPASKRLNLSIVTGATVSKILFSGSSREKLIAKEVLVTVKGEPRSFTAKNEIILSAGAFHTPKLLELSGVGDAHRLSDLDISSVIENAAVGENLQNHLMCLRTFELNSGVEVGEGIQSVAFLPLRDHGQQKEILDKGSSNSSLPNGFYDTIRNVYDSPDEATCSMFMTFIDQPDMACVGIMQAIPFSHGSTHIASADSKAAPVIDPRFLSDPLDLDIMANHLLALETICSTSPLSSFFRQSLPSDPAIHDLESARRFLRDNAVTTYHPCGTAAMLPRRKGGVVDEDLIVYGTANLRIVDASIFPVIPSVNPMSTVYAVAEKAAEIIKAGAT